MPEFNFIAIVLAAFVPLIVGSIWYAPKVMGNALAKINGQQDAKGHSPWVYLLTVAASFLIAMLLAAILSTHLDAERTLSHGMFHGGGAAVFMGIPTFFVIAIFEGKSAKYILIHALYWFISFILMGGIIGHLS